MIKEGALVNPSVDNIVALHSELLGKGAHGAYPHKSADPVLTSAQVVVALQEIISRELDALDKTVISICVIKGGTAFNIIPETVSLVGTVIL